jgi:membrane associated rhomboid family serine protease
MNKVERKALLNILFFPILFLIIMWAVKLVEYNFGIPFADYGVRPQSLSGLKGILFSPFIHGDFKHLINNSYPILILGGMLFFFYKKIAKQLFLWLFFIAGFWLWIIGGIGNQGVNPHIGASGVIYALAAFLLVSGIIGRNPRLYAVSMIIIFLYGSMIWGVIPPEVLGGRPTNISWQGHLAGFMAGVLVAIFYRNEGPKPKKYQWEIDEEIEEELEKELLKDNELKINYSIKKEDKPN